MINLNPFKKNKNPPGAYPQTTKSASGMTSPQASALAKKVSKSKVAGGNIRNFAKRYSDIEDLDIYNMAHKKGTHPNFADIHGDRHNRAQLHGKSPARQAALKRKMEEAKESKGKC